MVDLNLWLIAAALLCTATVGIHIFIGGPEVVPSLLKAESMTVVARATACYCWHIVTITLAAMGVAFAMSALTGTPDAALIATGLAVCFTGLNITLIITRKLPWLEMRQWALFAPIAALGVIGLV